MSQTLDLTKIRDYGKEYVVYFKSSDELKEFMPEWEAAGGSHINYEFNLRRAEAADLCLFLYWMNNGSKHSWSWSDKSYCFDEHPEYEVHTIDDLRVGLSDLGEIVLSELSLDLLFGGDQTSV